MNSHCRSSAVRRFVQASASTPPMTPTPPPPCGSTSRASLPPPPPAITPTGTPTSRRGGAGGGGTRKCGLGHWRVRGVRVFGFGIESPPCRLIWISDLQVHISTPDVCFGGFVLLYDGCLRVSVHSSTPIVIGRITTLSIVLN
jgi:hypothetical protein